MRPMVNRLVHTGVSAGTPGSKAWLAVIAKRTHCSKAERRSACQKNRSPHSLETSVSLISIHQNKDHRRKAGREAVQKHEWPRPRTPLSSYAKTQRRFKTNWGERSGTDSTSEQNCGHETERHDRKRAGREARGRHHFSFLVREILRMAPTAILA